MLVIFISLVLYIMPLSKIFKKLNYSGWLSLFILVPIVNIVVLWVIASSDRRTIPMTPVAVQQGKAFCTKCGTPLGSDVVFCGKCGTHR